MKSLQNNEMWELVDLPPRRNVDGNKWVYKVNITMMGCLVEKGYV